MYPYPAYSLRPVLCRSAPLSVERLRGRQQGEDGHRAQEQGHQEQEHQREGGPGQRGKRVKSRTIYELSPRCFAERKVVICSRLP